ncbi:cytochrome P450 [Pisolithus marmoratus]|nr:cytochrome P450 [Pisolithus marmoratus]
MLLPKYCQSFCIAVYMILLFVICTTCVAVSLWILGSRPRSKLPYPPGPKGLPFIGNALDIDPQRPQLTYAQWGKTYGDIVYTRTLGQDIVIVNSEKTARILVDGRSEIYSDRYRSSIYRVYGTDLMTPALEYGKEWKTHRRLFHLSLRNDVVGKYDDLHLNHARQLLENISCHSTNFFEHFDLYAGAVTIELIYGRRVEGKDDPIFAMANGLAETVCKEVTPNKVGLLKAMPFLQYLPSWFPGAGFKRTGAQCREMIAEMADVPFAMAKNEMERGELSHCMISDMLKHGEVEEAAAKAAVSSIYLAGAETTASVLKTIALIMTLYPDVQDNIHAELDTVVGRGNLPTFADRPRLPYLQAVLYEVMRWNPPAPLGLPHVTTASDIYEGYHIPKGTMVLFNYWAMKDHGYNNPERFDPTRHLTSDGQLSPQAKQKNLIFFGFGKRVCPGRFFADHALWAATAVMLSALKFDKAKDSSGKYMDIEPVLSCGLVSCPAPFPCSVTSRFVE